MTRADALSDEYMTLPQLKPNVGDVVQVMGGKSWEIVGIDDDGYCLINDYPSRHLSNSLPFRIVSRATPDAPVMTPNPRLTAAVAKLDAKDADTMATVFGYTLRELHNIIAEHERRIKPEPKRETARLYYGSAGDVRKIGTIDLIDGKPDPSSIKMNEVE